MAVEEAVLRRWLWTMLYVGIAIGLAGCDQAVTSPAGGSPDTLTTLSVAVSPATVTCRDGGHVDLTISVPDTFDRSRAIAVVFLNVDTGAWVYPPYIAAGQTFGPSTSMDPVWAQFGFRLQAALPAMTADADGHRFYSSTMLDGLPQWLCVPEPVWPNGRYAVVVYDFETRVELTRTAFTLAR